MTTTKQVHDYALRIPLDRARALAKAKEATGFSVNQLVVLCVDRALAEVVNSLVPAPRITNVAPLTDAVMDRLYQARQDESEGVSAKALRAMQIQEEPQ